MTVKVLCSSKWKRSLHPFYRWRKQLKDSGLDISFYFDHNDKRLREADNLLIYSKYYDEGWQSISKRTDQNERELIEYLSELKKSVGKLIWFDEAASSGSSDFSIIHFVDVFVKKQILKDSSYYTSAKEDADLRIWLNLSANRHITPFIKCPEDQAYKIRQGWNTSCYDYRYIRNKLSPLSNYLSYKFYSPPFGAVDTQRKYDVTFRGTSVYESSPDIALQRYKAMAVLDGLRLKISKGERVAKGEYLNELRSAKISISPFGFGEICYRDFETFIAGSVLIKPSLEHLTTFPNLFIANKTYIPVLWDLSDLQEKLENTVEKYHYFKEIARDGQDLFRRTLNSPEYFVEAVKRVIE